MSDLQSLDQLEEAFDREGVDVGLYRDLISRTRQHLQWYAELEIKLLDHVSFPVPLDVLQPVPSSDDSAGIETLAGKQRNRLREEYPSAGDLMTALDRDGIKVYCPPFPDGPIDGFFLFDATVGPVMVVRADLSVPAANGVFARLFGHYLLDNNPYRIRLSWNAPVESTAAGEFGAAFLMGVRMLDGYLVALGETGPPTPQTVLQLATYFETTPAMVIQRLVGMGRLKAEEAAALGDIEDSSVLPSDGHAVVSERFLRLALEANALGILTLKELSKHLEADEGVARGLADRFRLAGAEDPESN